MTIQAQTVSTVDLNVNELRYLIRVLEGTSIFGFPDEEFSQYEQAQRQSMLDAGEQSLLQRTLLADLGDGKLTISNSLLQAVGAAVHPVFSIWLTSEAKPQPVEKWYIQGRDAIASAHTVLDNNYHRFIRFEHPTEVVPWILDHLYLAQTQPTANDAVTISAKLVVAVDTALRAADAGTAFRLLREANVTAIAAQTVVHILRDAERLSGVVVFRTALPVPVPVANFSLATVDQSVWLLQSDPNSQLVTIRPSSVTEIQTQIEQGIELAQKEFVANS